MTALADDRRCFACGPENESGLRMTFEYGDGTARAAIAPDRRFGGWCDIIHGGVVATMLDEAMAHATLGTGVRTVTARMEVRFRKATPTGVPLIVEGVVRDRRGRVYLVEATLKGVDGTLYAESQGRFVAEASTAAGDG